MRTIAALAALVVVGASGVPSALAGTPAPDADATETSEVAEAAVAEEPAVEEPVVEEPEVEEPVAEEPVADEPVAEEPVADEPVAEEPVGEPVADEPVTDEPDQAPVVADEPTGSAPTASESAEPVAEATEEVEEAGPLGLTATSPSSGVIVVNWIPDMYGHDYYLRTYSPVHLTAFPAYGATTHTWTEVPPGTYTVYLDSMMYPMGDSTTVVVDAATAPTSPDALAVSVTDDDATVTWAAPLDEGTSPVTRYDVSVDGQSRAVDAPGLSTTFEDLAPGDYTVKVTASSDDGTSDPASEPFSVWAGPSAPVSVAATQTGADSISVSWSAPADPGHPGVDGYSVWLDGDEGDAVPVAADELSTTLTGVTPGEHTVSVRALSKHGDSDPGTAQVDVNAAPSEPQSLTAERTGRSSVAVAWAPPADLGHPGVANYEVLLDGERVSFLGASQLSATLDDVALGEHTVEVVAWNKHGHSEPTAFTFSMTALPTAPLEVVATQTGPTSVLVGWSSPDDEGEEEITGYRVTATPWGLPGRFESLGVRSAAGGLTQEVGPDVRSYEFTGLDEGMTYRFSVVAMTEAGDGPPATADEQTDEWRAPSVPTDVSVTQTGPGQVTVRFDAPVDPGTSDIVGYVLGLSGADFGGYEEFDADTREIVIDDLPAGEYSFRLLAVNEQGADGAPFDVDLTVVDAAPPVVETPTVVNAPVRTVVTAPTVTRTTATPATLARTGAEAGTVAVGGVLMLLLGAGALVAGRRRQVTNA